MRYKNQYDSLSEKYDAARDNIAFSQNRLNELELKPKTEFLGTEILEYEELKKNIPKQRKLISALSKKGERVANQIEKIEESKEYAFFPRGV